MGDSLLKEHWLDTLAVAANAVDAGTLAHALSPDVVRVERDQLRVERAWIETVDWKAVERTLDGSAAIFNAPSDQVGVAVS